MSDPGNKSSNGPYDEDNIWTVPAVDAGTILGYENNNRVRFVGTDFESDIERVLDGGAIPKAGEATFKPDDDYNPDSPF